MSNGEQTAGPLVEVDTLMHELLVEGPLARHWTVFQRQSAMAYATTLITGDPEPMGLQESVRDVVRSCFAQACYTKRLHGFWVPAQQTEWYQRLMELLID